jgi:hypothetical protein
VKENAGLTAFASKAIYQSPSLNGHEATYCCAGSRALESIVSRINVEASRISPSLQECAGLKPSEAVVALYEGAQRDCRRENFGAESRISAYIWVALRSGIRPCA